MRRALARHWPEYLIEAAGLGLFKANDLVHGQVRLAAAVQAMRAARAWFVSPGLVTLPDGQLGFRRAALVRDPDGHASQLAGRMTRGLPADTRTWAQQTWRRTAAGILYALPHLASLGVGRDAPVRSSRLR
jgi:hypothetical protein